MQTEGNERVQKARHLQWKFPHSPYSIPIYLFGHKDSPAEQIKIYNALYVDHLSSPSPMLFYYHVYGVRFHD